MPRTRTLGYGEGSPYYEKARNRWVGELRSGSVRRRVTGRTRGEVVQKLDELRSKLAQGVPIGDTTTVGAWVTWYLHTVIPATKDPRTAEWYWWALGQCETLYPTKLRDLTPQHVEQLLAELATRKPTSPTGDGRRGQPKGAARGPLGQSSLKRVRMALGGALDEAQRRRLVAWNPARLAHLPANATAPRPRRSLTPEQAKQLRALASERPNGALVLVALALGLRPGEVAGLPWSAIDFGKGTVTIKQAMVRVPGGGVTLGEPKKSSYRVLKMSSELATHLRRHRSEQRKTRLKSPIWHEELDLVFPNSIGGLMDHGRVLDIVRDMVAEVGIADFTAHEMRHTAASLLIDSGAQPLAVSDLLGHRNGRMVAETYRHQVQPVVDLSEHQARLLGGGRG